MLQFKILIFKLSAVNRLSARAITRCEVTALDHELFDDAMECRALVRERLVRLAHALFTGAKSTEVLSGLRNNIVVQLEGNTASRFGANGDIEEGSTTVGRHCESRGKSFSSE